MRAVQIKQAGGPDVLEMADVAVPEPEAGEVIIEVKAAGVNFIDTYQRSGLYPLELPFCPGLECAGIVSAVGDGVSTFSIGDRVAVGASSGSYAEFHQALAERVVSVPDGVSLEVAAACMVQALTAHYLAFDTYPLRSGDTCLIHAGAGGTGRLLIQLAKAVGAQVFTTVGTAEKAELAGSAGADHVINYRDVDFADAIREISGTDRPLDVVYDGVGASVFEQSLGLLRPRGLMATFGNASGPVDPVSPLDLMSGGSLYLTRPSLFDYISTRDELVERSADVFARIADGSLDVRIGATYALEDAAQAHRDLEARATTGKLLLVP